jgi:hypothetical protein
MHRHSIQSRFDMGIHRFYFFMVALMSIRAINIEIKPIQIEQLPVLFIGVYLIKIGRIDWHLLICIEIVPSGQSLFLTMSWAHFYGIILWIIVIPAGSYIFRTISKKGRYRLYWFVLLKRA